jgi:hypothetical protein
MFDPAAKRLYLREPPATSENIVVEEQLKGFENALNFPRNHDVFPKFTTTECSSQSLFNLTGFQF